MPQPYVTTVRVRAARAKTLSELGVRPPATRPVEVTVWGVPVAIVDPGSGTVLWSDDRLGDGESRAQFGQLVRTAVLLMARAREAGVCESDETKGGPRSGGSSGDEDVLGKLADLGGS